MFVAATSKSSLAVRSVRREFQPVNWQIGYGTTWSQCSKMEKPWIGIPTRYHEKSEYIGQIRHYLDAVLWAGGLPMLIPTTLDPEITREYVQNIQGVLLPGSPNDIDPGKYGEAPHAKLGKLHPEREITDFTILDFAEGKDLPVLGIC